MWLLLEFYLAKISINCKDELTLSHFENKLMYDEHYHFLCKCFAIMCNLLMYSIHLRVLIPLFGIVFFFYLFTFHVNEPLHYHKRHWHMDEDQEIDHGYSSWQWNIVWLHQNWWQGTRAWWKRSISMTWHASFSLFFVVFLTPFISTYNIRNPFSFKYKVKHFFRLLKYVNVLFSSNNFKIFTFDPLFFKMWQNLLSSLTLLTQFNNYLNQQNICHYTCLPEIYVCLSGSRSIYDSLSQK